MSEVAPEALRRYYQGQFIPVDRTQEVLQGVWITASGERWHLDPNCVPPSVARMYPATEAGVPSHVLQMYSPCQRCVEGVSRDRNA